MCQWVISYLLFFLKMGNIAIMEDFRDRVKAIKDAEGLSDAEFERRGGLVQGYYRDLMKRERTANPSMPKMISICRALGKRPDQVFPELEALYSEDAIHLLNELEEIQSKKAAIKEKLRSLDDKTS